jgi:hypothetical protein
VRYPAVVTNISDAIRGQHPVICPRQRCARGPLAGQGRSRGVKAAQAEILKRQLGLDKPLPLQYLVWLVGNDWMKVDADGGGEPESGGQRRGILRGGFGLSYRTRQPVPDEIAGRIPAGEGAGFRYEKRWLVRDYYGQGR